MMMMMMAVDDAYDDDDDNDDDGDDDVDDDNEVSEGPSLRKPPQAARKFQLIFYLGILLPLQ